MTYLIAPGSTVTSAAAIVLETVKVVESTTFTEPPDKGVALTLERAKVKDDAEWEVSKEIREAWGLQSDTRGQVE